MKVVVVGGGAAGFLAALTCKAQNPAYDVCLIEKSPNVLAKVKISGGGRCNVTHACFDPAVLATHYPRGSKELRGPFSRFQPRDTIDWFEKRGVKLKTESDGRVFPVSDNSQTIIDCLIAEAKKLGVQIRTGVTISTLAELDYDRLLLATGSSRQGWDWARQMGHTIVTPVPSLFSLTLSDPGIKELAGVAVQQTEVRVDDLTQKGPLLVTHWGVSGPAILRLSAWGARHFSQTGYRGELHINWLPDPSADADALPRRLRKYLESKTTADPFHDDCYDIAGKGPFKDEFVTAGGIELKEMNFKTMESKLKPGIFFAGEILDIDGITGGFNFQNAWTTGFLAGLALSS